MINAELFHLPWSITIKPPIPFKNINLHPIQFINKNKARAVKINTWTKKSRHPSTFQYAALFFISAKHCGILQMIRSDMLNLQSTKINLLSSYTIRTDNKDSLTIRIHLQAFIEKNIYKLSKSYMRKWGNRYPQNHQWRVQRSNQQYTNDSTTITSRSI